MAPVEFAEEYQDDVGGPNQRAVMVDRVEDFAVSNGERSVREVATEVMTRLRWPTP